MGGLDPTRGGGLWYKLVDNQSLYPEKRLSEVDRDSVAIDDSSPTKQPTTEPHGTSFVCLRPTNHLSQVKITLKVTSTSNFRVQYHSALIAKY